MYTFGLFYCCCCCRCAFLFSLISVCFVCSVHTFQHAIQWMYFMWSSASICKVVGNGVWFLSCFSLFLTFLSTKHKGVIEGVHFPKVYVAYAGKYVILWTIVNALQLNFLTFLLIFSIRIVCSLLGQAESLVNVFSLIAKKLIKKCFRFSYISLINV